MIFKGGTPAKRRARVENWHKHFCIIPRQFDTGEWVWLQSVWRILDVRCGDFVYMLTITAQGYPLDADGFAKIGPLTIKLKSDADIERGKDVVWHDINLTWDGNPIDQDHPQIVRTLV